MLTAAVPARYEIRPAALNWLRSARFAAIRDFMIECKFEQKKVICLNTFLIKKQGGVKYFLISFFLNWQNPG